MKGTETVSRAVASVALSIIASTLASWLLRRALFLTEQPGTAPDQSPRSAVVVVIPVFAGNTIGSQFYVRRRPPFGRWMQRGPNGRSA